ncbi:TM2 domain-containing protein [Halocola ammonii]
MKRFTQLFTAFVVASFFLASCATSSDVTSSNLIQKRKYRKGFFVASLNKRKKDEKKSQTEEVKANEDLTVLAARNLETASLETSTEREPESLSSSSTPVEVFLVPAKSAELNSDCDIIVLTNGDEIEARVLEITEDEVRYKKCDRLNGPTYTKSRDNIVLIRYPDGSKDMFNNEKVNKSRENSWQDDVNKAGDDINKATEELPIGDKSQVVAAVLCFFLWGLAIHRFYLGYVGIGILQILTLGGCGIWALVDFIRILMGTLKPKNSEYEETFDDI